MFQLVVAKCWDPNPKDYFSVPRTEPVRPIDPGAWVAHTAAVRGLEIPQYPGGAAGYPGTAVGGVGGVPVGGALRAPSVSTLTSSSPSLASTVQERAGPGGPGAQLTIQSGMKAICSNMQRQDSGLEVRDRMWLKINIPQAFIGNYSLCTISPGVLPSSLGADVVNWLFSHVAGFADRRESRKYASQMLKVTRYVWVSFITAPLRRRASSDTPSTSPPSLSNVTTPSETSPPLSCPVTSRSVRLPTLWSGSSFDLTGQF